MSQLPTDDHAGTDEPTVVGPPSGPPPGRPPVTSWWHRRWVWALAVLVPLAVAAGVIAFAISDNGNSKPGTTTTTQAAPATTATPTTAATTTTAPGATTTAKPPVTTVAPLDATTAVWPAATGTLRYSSPTDAARGFATDLVGFVDPVVGPFRQGDTRSGEVDVEAKTGAPITTVLVRQLGNDGSWWVLGANTANLQVTAPAALATITSPLSLTGTSVAFEAQFSATVVQDGSATPLGTAQLMGGATEMGPFTGTLTFDHPTAADGALIVFDNSAETGHVLEATVVRVHFR